MRMVVDAAKDGEFNAKRLMWRLGYSITYLEEATGIPYRKLQRILRINQLKECKLEDVMKLADAMGYDSLDKFLNECIEANECVRTYKMDELLERAITNQIKYGTMLKKDIEDILLEGSYSQKVRRVGKATKDILIMECLTKQQPEDLMDLYKISTLIGPDKQILYMKREPPE